MKVILIDSNSSGWQEFGNYLSISTTTIVVVDQSPDGDLLRINFNFRFGHSPPLTMDPRWSGRAHVIIPFPQLSMTLEVF